MRKLIIIGNGFDLAHGLKTGYKHFLDHLIRKALDNFLKELEQSDYEEDLTHDSVVIKLQFHAGEKPYDVKTSTTSNYKECITLLKREKCLYNGKGTLGIEFCPLLNMVLDNRNWVDLETAYFSLLTENHQDPDEVKKLNTHFAHIREEIIVYLKSLKIDKIDRDPDILGYLQNQLSTCDSKQNLILSFNYTSLAQKYAKALRTQYIPIHGRLEKEDEVIFGMGNEHHDKHEKFAKIDKAHENGLLRYHKSILYSRAPHYQNMVRWMTRNPVSSNEDHNFAIYVYGHSLGSSDSPLLQHIINHENCREVHRHYYDGGKGRDSQEARNNHQNQVINLNRYFHDAHKARTKILNFTDSQPMPQVPDDTHT